MALSVERAVDSVLHSIWRELFPARESKVVSNPVLAI